MTATVSKRAVELLITLIGPSPILMKPSGPEDLDAANRLKLVEALKY